MITLVLRPRANDNWHDAAVLINALDAITAGMTVIKAARWIMLASNIQIAAEAAMPNGKMSPVEVALGDQEAGTLWNSLIRLRPEQFGRNSAGGYQTPHVGLLGIMLVDIGAQLGREFPKQGDDD